LELHRRILLGEYTQVQSVFQYSDWIQRTLGIDHRQVQLDANTPPWLEANTELLAPTLLNLLQNAESHGEKAGSILFSTDFEEGQLKIELHNKPGVNHAAMLELQACRGQNFLFSGETYHDADIRKQGCQHSTFLGTDEIARYVKIAGGSLHMMFEAEVVITRLYWPARMAEEPNQANIKLNKPPAGLCFVIADDDITVRMVAPGLLKMAAAHSDSLILGATHDEAVQLADTIRKLAAKHTETKVVCILDQNLDTYIGHQPIYGTDVVRELRRTNFKGILCIRSANDERPQEYFAAGADIVIGKRMSVWPVKRILHEISKFQPEECKKDV